MIQEVFFKLEWLFLACLAPHPHFSLYIEGVLFSELVLLHHTAHALNITMLLIMVTNSCMAAWSFFLMCSLLVQSFTHKQPQRLIFAAHTPPLFKWSISFLPLCPKHCSFFYGTLQSVVRAGKHIFHVPILWMFFLISFLVVKT